MRHVQEHDVIDNLAHDIIGVCVVTADSQDHCYVLIRIVEARRGTTVIL